MGHTNWPPFKHEIKEPRTGKKCREQRKFQPENRINQTQFNFIFFFFYKFSSGAPPPLGFIQLVNYRNLCN